MLADPHVGDRDPRTRGPPAAARRAAGRDRPADRHLRGQRRAHEHRSGRPRCRSASCSTSSTRTVRTETGPRAGPRRRPPPAAALRPAQLHARRARPAHAVELRRRHARRGARARRATAPPRRRSSPARSRPTGAAAGRARRPRPLRRAPGARVPAPAARHRARRLQPRRRGRAAGRARRPRALGRRPAAARRRARRRRAGRRASRPRSRAGRFRPAGSRCPVIDRIRPTVEEIAGHAAARARQRHRAGVASTSASCSPTAGRSPAPWRASAATSCGTSRTRASSARHRLAAWVRLLALCAAHPERRLLRRDGRAGAVRRAGHARARRSRAFRPSTGAEALAHLAALVDLWDRGMREPLPIACEASAAYARPSRAARPGHRGREGVGVGLELPARGRRARAPARASAASSRSRTCSRSRRAPTRPAPAGTTRRPTRFGRLARRLWDGALAREAVVDQ